MSGAMFVIRSRPVAMASSTVRLILATHLGEVVPGGCRGPQCRYPPVVVTSAAALVAESVSSSEEQAVAPTSAAVAMPDGDGAAQDVRS